MPMPRDLLERLECLLDVPLIEAYGMTEAAPQISSNRLPPHPRKPGSVGKAAHLMFAAFSPRLKAGDRTRTGDVPPERLLD
jgi:acyl-CoA synthetase (AMP-forming)/AMP-acid ligase II